MPKTAAVAEKKKERSPAQQAAFEKMIAARDAKRASGELGQKGGEAKTKAKTGKTNATARSGTGGTKSSGQKGGAAGTVEAPARTGAASPRVTTPPIGMPGYFDPQLTGRYSGLAADLYGTAWLTSEMLKVATSGNSELAYQHQQTINHRIEDIVVNVRRNMS